MPWPQAHCGELPETAQDDSMSNKPSNNLSRAMKGNHRSSGKGAEMERTVYVDDGGVDSRVTGRNVFRVVLVALVALALAAGFIYFVT